MECSSTSSCSAAGLFGAERRPAYPFSGIGTRTGACAQPDGGDFSTDFTAAAPLTYDHTTGGGAYNERDVGRDKDIVESLEGGDFEATTSAQVT